MIGEASHGTHEYYTWRAALTRRLIAERGFSFVAVEGDWPDCERVNAAVRGGDATPMEALVGYERWPTWMWANEEVVDFAEWLRSYNAALPADASRRASGSGSSAFTVSSSLSPTSSSATSLSPTSSSATSLSPTSSSATSLSPTSSSATFLSPTSSSAPSPSTTSSSTSFRADKSDKIGFHGLDVYSMWESLREVLVWLRENDPDQVEPALHAYHCLASYSEDPQSYAWATKFLRASCEDDVVRMLIDLRGRDLAVWQNAEVVAGAEHYYRAMVHGGPHSWNVRDRHMDATLARLLDHYGEGSKAVVWAHNTHVGDANATDQATLGEVTIGSLARERFGADQVVLVGLGSHRGSVIAGRTWGAPMAELRVPPGRPGSLEDILHATAPKQALFVFPPLAERPDLLVDEVAHRAIGVVYRPEQERLGNYVPSVLGDRYDAFLWFDETRALRPLHPLHIDTHEFETYPTGV
ncbi:erythromycin esterase family protein [Paractinoplanes ovalisporus]